MNRLPLEMWQNIFKFLNTTDLLNFCEAFGEYKQLLQNKPLVENFDLSNFNRYDLDIYRYVEGNVGTSLVRLLNINGLYWVDLPSLRKLIKGLPNLKELLALDTCLGFRRRDVFLYSKLEILALTVRNMDFINDTISNSSMPMLKRLCVKIISLPANITTFYKTFERFSKLEELWLEYVIKDFMSIKRISLKILAERIKLLQKLVVKVRRDNLLEELQDPNNFTKVFEKMKDSEIAMYYVKCLRKSSSSSSLTNIPYLLSLDLEEIQFFSTPYRFDVCGDLYMNREMSNINIDELTFCHNFCNLSARNVLEMFDILLRHSKNLRKLRLTSCMFSSLSTFALSLSDHEMKNKVNTLVVNCKLLKDLQIFCCDQDFNHEESFDLISSFPNLEKLTISLIGEGNGFHKVLTNCLKLKSLRISADTRNPKLNSNIIHGLRNGSFLEQIILISNSLNPVFILKHLNDIRFAKLKVFALVTFLPEYVEIYNLCRITLKEKGMLDKLCYQYQKDHRERIYGIFRKEFQLRYYSRHTHVAYMNLMDVDSDWSTVDLYKFK